MSYAANATYEGAEKAACAVVLTFVKSDSARFAIVSAIINFDSVLHLF